MDPWAHFDAFGTASLERRDGNPPAAMAVVPDVAVIFGFVWAGLMFASAALNVVVALNFSVVTWSVFMSIYGIVSKVGLMLIGFATMRTIGVRRRRAQTTAAAATATVIPTR